MDIPASGVSQTRHALLIAYHYPPCGLSSGLQRTLCFSRDLPSYGWSPLVLTINPQAYPVTKTDQLDQVPDGVPVRRTFGLDSKRHLGFHGRYFSWTALPDAAVTWLIGAIPAGLRMIRRYKPEVLWSTYPLATSHLIGLALHRLTGIPWIADFRDPMTEIDPLTQERFPEDPRLWKTRRWVEKETLKHCVRAVFVTPGSLRIHQERYPRLASRMTMIANGYDEDNFAAAERVPALEVDTSGRLVLVHSGVLYPGPDRDPTALFAALAQLRREGKVSVDTLEIRLRATGYDNHYRERIRTFGLEDMVLLKPAISYQQALAEMLTADGLLLFQGSTSNPAVPAKLYEYLRARRPIFALVDKDGDTASILRQDGVGRLVPLNASDKIAEGLLDFIAQVRNGTATLPKPYAIERHSRKLKAKELASLMNQVARQKNS